MFANLIKLRAAQFSWIPCFPKKTHFFASKEHFLQALLGSSRMLFSQSTYPQLSWGRHPRRPRRWRLSRFGLIDRSPNPPKNYNDHLYYLMIFGWIDICTKSVVFSIDLPSAELRPSSSAASSLEAEVLVSTTSSSFSSRLVDCWLASTIPDSCVVALPVAPPAASEAAASAAVTASTLFTALVEAKAALPASPVDRSINQWMLLWC